MMDAKTQSEVAALALRHAEACIPLVDSASYSARDKTKLEVSLTVFVELLSLIAGKQLASPINAETLPPSAPAQKPELEPIGSRVFSEDI